MNLNKNKAIMKKVYDNATALLVRGMITQSGIELAEKIYEDKIDRAVAVTNRLSDFLKDLRVHNNVDPDDVSEFFSKIGFTVSFYAESDSRIAATFVKTNELQMTEEKQNIYQMDISKRA